MYIWIGVYTCMCMSIGVTIERWCNWHRQTHSMARVFILVSLHSWSLANVPIGFVCTFYVCLYCLWLRTTHIWNALNSMYVYTKHAYFEKENNTTKIACRYICTKYVCLDIGFYNSMVTWPTSRVRETYVERTMLWCMHIRINLTEHNIHGIVS